MLVVRFPAGVSATYNNANHLHYEDHGFDPKALRHLKTALAGFNAKTLEWK